MTALLLATLLAAQGKTPPALKAEAGFLRASFFSDKGNVTVILPDDIAVGDKVSATIFSDIKDVNVEKIQVSLGDKFGNVSDTVGTRRNWTIGATADARLTLTVWSPEGVLLGSTYVPVSPAKPKATAFVIPSFARIASPVAIKGVYDGEAGNTIVKMGDQVLPVVAESPRETVVLVPTVSIPGQNTMEIQEESQQAKAPCRLLKVNLSTPKTTLQKGDRVALMVVVEGVSDLDKSPAPMIVVENLTPKAIDLDGKVKHYLFAKPSKDGDYSHSFIVTSLLAGSFSVSAVVDPGSGTKIETTK